MGEVNFIGVLFYCKAQEFKCLPGECKHYGNLLIHYKKFKSCIPCSGGKMEWIRVVV